MAIPAHSIDFHSNVPASNHQTGPQACSEYVVHAQDSAINHELIECSSELKPLIIKYDMKIKSFKADLEADVEISTQCVQVNCHKLSFEG